MFNGAVTANDGSGWQGATVSALQTQMQVCWAEVGSAGSVSAGAAGGGALQMQVQAQARVSGGESSSGFVHTVRCKHL